MDTNKATSVQQTALREADFPSDLENGKPVTITATATAVYQQGHRNTENDINDMRRLGKKQEFKRNFGLLSTLGFISIYMATWEFVLVSLSVGLVNGGFGGLFWVFVGTVTCYGTIVVSLAELESMAPTSGGQYHWVSEFAPPKYQKLLSYTAGWMSTLGWLASMASSVFILTTLIEAIIQIQKTEFEFPNWQYTLIMLAFLVITIDFNTWGAKILPMLETISLFGHIIGFIVTIIALWVMVPKNSARQVFIEVTDNGGGSNVGTSCLVAQIYVLYCNLGSDSAIHISEEVENASLNVPKAMWWSYILNVVIGLIMLITILFCLGDLNEAIKSPAPYLILFKNTGSTAMALTLMIILLILIYAGNITALATTSRELFAFARDKGFPCSTWISKINPQTQVPDNSVYLTALTSGTLCLLNLISTFAFETIVSLTLLALLSTYMISIGIILRLRLLGYTLPPARWSLGRFGIPINIFAFLYSGFVIVFCCFPVSVPVTLVSANWAPLVWVVVILIALIVYVVHGKRKYTAPVVFVEGRRVGDVGIQST